MRFVAAIAVVLLGCASAAPRQARVRKPPRTAFALRPLSITVEGTSERRTFGDPVFLGVHVTHQRFDNDRRMFASVMTRYMRLPVTSPNHLFDGCEHLWADCMAPVGKQLGARVIVWGTAVITVSEVGIVLRALDVEKNQLLAKYEEMMPLVRADPEAIKDMVERARHAVLAGEESVLLVESELEGTVIVDADRRLPLVRPRTRIPVAKGAHVVAVESRGYARTERVVEVAAGYFVRVVVKK